MQATYSLPQQLEVELSLQVTPSTLGLFHLHRLSSQLWQAVDLSVDS